MAELEDEHHFPCPYCSSEVSILIDPSGGRRQTFTWDCEVCCRPMVIRLEWGDGGLQQFVAEQES